MSTLRKLSLACLLLLPFLLVAAPALGAIGLASPEISVTNQNGSPDAQAGSHPYALTTSFLLSEGILKDTHVELPPGLVGNPGATPKCSYQGFTEISAYHLEGCPNDSAVGTAVTHLFNGEIAVTSPVYNLPARPGVPAEFGYKVLGLISVFLDTTVRTGSDYGLTIDARNIPNTITVFGAKVTIWGVPAAPNHDALRGLCVDQEEEEAEEVSTGDCPAGVPAQPLLSNPTSCGAARTATLSVDGWETPGSYLPDGSPNLEDPNWKSAPFSLPPITGCEKLDFSPSLSVVPESSSGDSPTGLRVDLHVPQPEAPNGLAESDLKNAELSLPAGVTIDPAAASGLVGCSEAQIELAGSLPASCPNASKIGSVELLTPLIGHPLPGAIYVAQQGNAGPAQGANEFGSLLALYVAIDDPETGVVVKLAGRVTLDPTTGQLAVAFTENPQLPFGDLRLDFFGGERAPLVTPQSCGAYTATSVLAPWSQGASAEPFSTFQISSGPGGSPCAAPGFAPGFTAGTTNNQAGAYSPFTTTLTRRDGEQALGGAIAMTLPPGLEGMLSSITPCGEAQANAGACPAASQIGHVTVRAGVGQQPIVLPEPGKPEDPVYLTKGYEGAPFGLAIVVHPQAGPFNLEENGQPIVVLAKLEVNPLTAQVSLTSGPLPSILQGIPLDVRSIAVTIERVGGAPFLFNPTNCTALSLTGSIAPTQGASQGVSSPFQAANCANLPFKPSLSASTAAHASKADGASLIVKLLSKGGPQAGGGEANIRSVAVELPRQLPSRLTTLQKACTAAQFEANPAGCPAESNVGTASASTPVLSGALTGPAYLVSHGGAAFPDLEIVLQGEGIKLILDGTTDVRKGITSSTFSTLPDAPISSFELTLPTGPHSIFGTNLPASANYSLCGQTLRMPTTLTGQNGAALTQTTQIAVTGCKPAITVVSHTVKGKTATVQVRVPGAGKLVATAKGLSKASKTAKAATTLTLKLTLTNAEAAFLGKHKARKLKARVNLTFTPKRGGKLKTTTTVLIG